MVVKYPYEIIPKKEGCEIIPGKYQLIIDENIVVEGTYEQCFEVYKNLKK